jgi:hypothetical protein
MFPDWRGPAGGWVRLGTNVSPFQSTTALATTGIYKWTRNPVYCGGTLAMLGIAFCFALDWMVLLIVPSMIILHFGVVRREERYLEQKFGEQYRQYTAQVSRYGWRIWSMIPRFIAGQLSHPKGKMGALISFIMNRQHNARALTATWHAGLWAPCHG